MYACMHTPHTHTHIQRLCVCVCVSKCVCVYLHVSIHVYDHLILNLKKKKKVIKPTLTFNCQLMKDQIDQGSVDQLSCALALVYEVYMST